MEREAEKGNFGISEPSLLFLVCTLSRADILTSALGSGFLDGKMKNNKVTPTTGDRLQEQENWVVACKPNEGEEVSSCEQRSEF